MSRNISFQGELLRVCAIAFLASIIVGNQAAGRSAQSKSSPSSAQISNIQTIGIEQAYYLYRENAAVFVDTRESAAFEIGHVPGAVNTPDIASLSAKTVDQLKAAANIVVYGHRGMAGRPNSWRIWPPFAIGPCKFSLEGFRCGTRCTCQSRPRNRRTCHEYSRKDC